MYVVHLLDMVVVAALLCFLLKLLFNWLEQLAGFVGGSNRPETVQTAVDLIEILSEDAESPPAMKPAKTPMKTLIAQEMSREVDTMMFQEMDKERKSPSVIARLMGLDDTVCAGRKVIPTKSYTKDGDSSHSESGERAAQNYQLREAEYYERFMPAEVHHDGHENRDHTVAYESKERPSRTNCFNDDLLPQGWLNDGELEKRMSLVREKLLKAKCLMRHEKLSESKEFDDVIDILSYNRDLFLKFLEEPNSLFSKHLKKLHLIAPPRQEKQISVLKQSEFETKSADQVKHYKYDRFWEMQKFLLSSDFGHPPKTEKLSQPTRIVILKPTPRKHYELKAPATSSLSLPEPPERVSCNGGLRAGISIDSREVAREFTLQMHENLSRHQRDESLLSSVISDGYVGDESSFNRSEGYREEQDMNIDDSDTPSCWHYNSSRHGSPSSYPTLSQVSHSPVSFLEREAKQRLSERCALVAINGLQEQLQERRSSTTLAEMLAIRQVKSKDMNGIIGPSQSIPCSREKDFRMPATCLSFGMRVSEKGKESNVNLARSKSIPNSSSFDNVGLNTEDSESWEGKSATSTGIAKPTNGKTSFKGRVSSLFFLKNKKGGREKSASSLLANSPDVLPTINANIASKNLDDSLVVHSSIRRESSPGNFEVAPDRIFSLAVPKDKQDEIIKVTPLDEKPGCSCENQEMRGIPVKLAEKQDQPSPTSILDAPFKDDLNDNATSSSKIANMDNPQALSRSTPIQSISRSPSWDVSCSESATNPLDLSRACRMAGDHGTEDLFFVQNLLSVSGLYKNRLSSIFNGWHSPDTPCDPKLLDMLLDGKEGETKSRSNQKLPFDLINLVLLEMGHAAQMGAFQRALAHNVLHDDARLAAQVEPLVKRIPGEVKWAAVEAKNGSHMVERLLWREVAGREWSEFLQLEMVSISEEIGLQVLNYLFEEALLEFSAD